MADDQRPARQHDGLSPSSLSLFMSCRRQYYLKKVARVAVDPDAIEDTEALRIGKAFHRCLEVTQHLLRGFSLLQAEKVVCGEFELDDFQTLPMIMAMLMSYRDMHNKAGLRAIAFEQPIDTPVFYGIVDVVLEDDLGGWWVGDMKTAASFSASLIPSLSGHPQLNLYAHYVPSLAAKLGLGMEFFRGCRYRLTTKSKLIRKKDEAVADFIGRVRKSVDSYDFILPKAKLWGEGAVLSHQQAREYVRSFSEKKDYAPNYGACMSYFRPCSFWSQCHGKPFTEMMGVDCVKSD